MVILESTHKALHIPRGSTSCFPSRLQGRRGHGNTGARPGWTGKLASTLRQWTASPMLRVHQGCSNEPSPPCTMGPETDRRKCIHRTWSGIHCTRCRMHLLPSQRQTSYRTGRVGLRVTEPAFDVQLFDEYRPWRQVHRQQL